MTQRWQDVRPRVVTDGQQVAEYRHELDAGVDRAQRLAAGFALARHLGTQEGREQVAAAGHRDGQGIVVVLSTDNDTVIAARISQHAEPVIVVEYDPANSTLSIRQDERP